MSKNLISDFLDVVVFRLIWCIRQQEQKERSMTIEETAVNNHAVARRPRAEPASHGDQPGVFSLLSSCMLVEK